jgi:23S rRNA pseudouridine2604 synthase
VAEPIRLSKRVAAQVPCSRRDAERLIEAGRVRVDGVVVDVPEARVGEHQQVEVAQALEAVVSAAPATLLLHQPAGVDEAQALALLRADQHWTGDPDRTPLQRQHLRGLHPLLPLPPLASGLAVFSQHRGIVRKLTEEAGLIEQELVVEVAGQIAEGGLARLQHGLAWQGRPLPPLKVSWQSERRLRFALKGVEPARVPWMCAQVGLEMVQMRRIRIGRLPMAALPAGQWRWLQPAERF